MTAPQPGWNLAGSGAAEDGALAASDRMTELGVSGLKGARPQEGWLYEEFLPQLRGIRGAQIYRQMGDNDPVVGAALFAFTMLLRNVKWTFEAVDKSTAAIEARDWAESVFFKDMYTPWGDVITDILSFLQYGFAPAEVTYKVRRGENDDPRKASLFDDGTIGISKIAVRAQDTIWRWHFDDFGDVLKLEQFVMGRPNAMIPAEKLLIFRTVSNLNNPEGRSVIRNCYVTWVRKNTLEEAEGRAAIRAAGLVVGRIPGRFLDPSAGDEERAVASAWKGIFDKIAQDKMGAVMMPSDLDPNTKAPLYDVSFVTTEQTRPANMSEVVDRYDHRMLSSMLADFILLGQREVGSFALSSDKTNIFALACGAYLSTVADLFNRVQLRRLWNLNNFDEKVLPKLVPGDLEKVDLTALGAFITALASAGAQLFPDPRLEDNLRATAGLPATLEQG